MGNVFSDKKAERAKRAERAEQERVKRDIRELQNEMEIRSRAHNMCAEYYGKWKSILFVLLLLVGGLSAGHKFLGWKIPPADDPTSIAIFALGVAATVAAFVIQQCHSRTADAHEKHHKAQMNCQSIADRARSASDSSESSSSLRKRHDALLKDKGNSSEISYEQWAYDRASKK